MTFHARALGLRRRLFGIDHRATVSSTFNVAEDAIGRKRPAEAREALRELGTRIAQHPPAERAWYAIKLGDIARLEGSLSAALEEHQQAIALYDAMPERDPIFGVAYFDVGRDLLDLGRPKEAIGALESAARLWEAIGNDEAADAWLELGLAYFGSGDAARGRQLVRRAQAVYAKSPELADPEMHAKADAWLASHG
jgi:tetratricopeptide (TPR) repeat protein